VSNVNGVVAHSPVPSVASDTPRDLHTLASTPSASPLSSSEYLLMEEVVQEVQEAQEAQEAVASSI